MDESKPEPTVIVDAAFVKQHNIAARYLAGQLTPRQAADFERFCRENPALLDQTGLSDTVNSGVRLLDVAGLKQPWDPEPLKFWQRLPVVIGLAVVAAGFTLATRYYYNDAAAANEHAAKLEKFAADEGAKAISGTETIKIEPERSGPAAKPQFEVDLVHGPRWLDLHFNMAWHHARAYRISFERAGEGRELILDNVVKDSNGDLHVELNSSLLGSGPHSISIEAEGLGAADLSAVAWSAFEVTRPRR